MSHCVRDESLYSSIKGFLSISLIRYNIKHQQDRWDNQQHQEDFLCMKSNPVIFKFPA